MTHALKRVFRLSISFLALAALAGMGSFTALAASTPTPGWISATPCLRVPRSTPVISWIETPEPVGTPVIPQTGKEASGSQASLTVALKDLPAGPDASAATKAAVEQVLVEISQCAAFPDDGVDAYFSDDYFRRTVVVQHPRATPGGASDEIGYSWGFEGIGDPGVSPHVTKAWELPGGKIGAVVQTAPDRALLFIVFVQAPKTGDWLIDEMATLSNSIGTPTPSP